jgi:hypothetical protein
VLSITGPEDKKETVVFEFFFLSFDKFYLCVVLVEIGSGGDSRGKARVSIHRPECELSPSPPTP